MILLTWCSRNVLSGVICCVQESQKWKLRQREKHIQAMSPCSWAGDRDQSYSNPGFNNPPLHSTQRRKVSLWGEMFSVSWVIVEKIWAHIHCFWLHLLVVEEISVPRAGWCPQFLLKDLIPLRIPLGMTWDSTQSAWVAFPAVSDILGVAATAGLSPPGEGKAQTSTAGREQIWARTQPGQL